MPPRGDDVCSSDIHFPLVEGKGARRRSSDKRISGRSFFKFWSNRTANNSPTKATPSKPSLKRSLSEHNSQLVVDSPTAQVSAEHSAHGDDAYASAKVSYSSRSDSASGQIPFEVTVVEEHFGGSAYVQMDQRLEQAEMEAQEYRQQLMATQSLLDVISTDLRKERSRVQDLIYQNKRLLTEVMASAGKDEATMHTETMMKQEMLLLKICLFLSMVFVMCGGRPIFLALVVVLWTFVDIFAG
jgi:hypothetical protein